MYKCQTLENGLTIIGEEIPYLKSISLGIWVKAGSIIETKENSGVSHFIEHMLFKGTKNRSSKELAREIDNLGGILNAFTSKECTCFYVKLLDEHIDIGIDVLSDMILNSCFDKKDIEKEKSVILEELKMYEDSPDDLSYDLLLENIYKDHSLGMNILGDRNTLKNFKRENILDKLENEVNKINYKELDSFKTNLLSYTSQIRDNISKYGDKIDTKNENKYETLLISSIQMYYEFINEIKAA